jgi:hypothetical protein
LGCRPEAQATAAELQELRAPAGQWDAAARENIRYWDFWSPAHRWNEMLIDTAVAQNLGAVPGIRSFAMLNVALHDALIAAWDSKYAHNRRRPGEADPQLATALPSPRSPSYPCERAVAAGAGAAVLAHLFPKEVPRFAEAIEESSQTRVHWRAADQRELRLGHREPGEGMMISNGISGKRFSTHISPTIQCAEHPDHFGDFLKWLVL